MKRKILLTAAIIFAFFCTMAREPMPGLDFVMDLHVKLGVDWILMGDVPAGTRTIIPIAGGTFSGPGIEGDVISGGADYQLHCADAGLTRLHAIYTIRTHDGVDILVDNQGVISEDDGGQYFFSTPRFEAPSGCAYSWLNSRIFVCRPVGFEPGYITLRVWMVK